MSAITDIMGRLDGDLIALQGFMSKFAPVTAGAPTPTTTFDQPAPPPPAKPAKADYDFLKKLLDEVQALAKSASDEVDKELKVPQPEEASAPTSSSGSGKK